MGRAYTLAEFLEYYDDYRAWNSEDSDLNEQCDGWFESTEMWEDAKLWSAPSRIAPNGLPYSLEAFEQWYGEDEGRRKWRAAPISNIAPLLRLMTDVERRTTLHLAHLRT